MTLHFWGMQIAHNSHMCRLLCRWDFECTGLRGGARRDTDTERKCVTQLCLLGGYATFQAHTLWLQGFPQSKRQISGFWDVWGQHVLLLAKNVSHVPLEGCLQWFHLLRRACCPSYWNSRDFFNRQRSLQRMCLLFLVGSWHHCAFWMPNSYSCLLGCVKHSRLSYKFSL